MENLEELNAKLASEIRPIEEMGQYLQDKLIAVSTAIMGFTVIMFGSEKIVLLNVFLLKLSWLLFGIYLVMAVFGLWANINYRARKVLRDALIRADEVGLCEETNDKKKREKQVLIGLLKFKDFLDRDYWNKSKNERESDQIRERFRELANKYKEELSVLSLRKNQDIDYRSKRDRVIDYLMKHYEWPYLMFGLGLLALVLSSLF